MSLILVFLVPGTAVATIQKEKFDQIIESLEKIYSPVFHTRQQLLNINANWDSERFEALARYEMDRHGKIAIIDITGAVARHPAITEEAFATIVCHEIGHFLAGQPAYRGFSTEGQADYFAASGCMRRLLPQLPENFFSSPPRAPWAVKRRCIDAYESIEEVNICIRSTMGGYGLSAFVAYRKSQNKPNFETPDPLEAGSLSFSPNTVQCRLDTFIVASLCNPVLKQHVDSQRPWLCSRKGDLAHLARPLCWYPRNPSH